MFRQKTLLTSSLLWRVVSVRQAGTQRIRKKPPNTSHHKFQHRHWWLQKRLEPHSVDEKLSEENRDFMKELVRDTYASSPLQEEPWPRGEWAPGTRRVGVLAQKVGMIPQWTKEGKRFLTTLLWVKDNHVVSYTPWEIWSPGYVNFELWWKARRYSKEKLDKVVVGADGQDPRKFTSSYLGLYNDTGLMPKRSLTAFYVSRNAIIQPGTPLSAMHFRVGEYVDCSSRTICFGFQGVMKRWGFAGGPSDERGATKFHRRPGSIAGGFRGRVAKGKKMPGRMGGQMRTIRGLKIWRINTKYNILYVHGPIPGPLNCWVRVWDTKAHSEKKQFKDDPYMPTYFDGDIDDVAEEYMDTELFSFNDESIRFKEEDKKSKIAVRNR